MPWKPQSLKKRTPPTVDLRGSACSRGYDRKWRKARLAYLNDNPFCEMCQESGKPVQAELVDHIVPLNRNGERLSEANFQSLCYSCHARKTAAERCGQSAPFGPTAAVPKGSRRGPGQRR